LKVSAGTEIAPTFRCPVHPGVSAMLKTHIGPYQLIREIADDRIGTSFEAVDHAVNKKVILKYLRPERVIPEILPRLYSEAKTLASLNHPHIGRVFGFVRRVDQLYLVMEFLEGQTLEDILKNQGRMQPAVALALFRQIMAGVAFAHRLGVIHGDLKPSNILVPDLGRIKILNFAIAHIVGSSQPVDSRESSLSYVSPEQLEGNPPDARSDIYSLGMMLYEMIVGKSPYDAYRTADDRVSNAQDEIPSLAFIPVPPSVVLADLPKWLDEFLLRMVARSPSDRFQSIKEMGRVLEVEIAHINQRYMPKRGTFYEGLWRQGRQGSYLISIPKNLVRVAGNRSLESIKNAASAIAKFPIRLPYTFADRPKSEHVRVIFKRVFHPIFSASNYFLQTKPLLESLKKRFPARVKADWRRYLQAACLLALISVESFYFRGANISFLIDSRLLSGPSLNDAVDSMFARINREELKPAVSEVGKRELATGLERQNRNRQELEKPASPVPIRVRPEPLKRLPVNRPQRAPIASNPKRGANVPLENPSKVQEQKVNEPVTTPQNTTLQSQLNVKWEN
jgi:serine/threonine protein kinase